jgi:hypothetical protein
MSRNEPRKASKNVKFKRDLKKAKKIVKDSLTDMPGFYAALRSTTEEGRKEIAEKKDLLRRIDKAESSFKGKSTSGGRNVPREFRNGGKVSLGEFKGSF